MKVTLKKSIALNGKAFVSGKKVHDMPDSFKDHWFFMGLVKSGDAVILEPAPSPVKVKEVAVAPVVEPVAEQEVAKEIPADEVVIPEHEAEVADASEEPKVAKGTSKKKKG